MFKLTIVCDGKDCPATLGQDVYGDDLLARDLDDLKRRAYREGWRRKPDHPVGDLCPACVAKLQGPGHDVHPQAGTLDGHPRRTDLVARRLRRTVAPPEPADGPPAAPHRPGRLSGRSGLSRACRALLEARERGEGWEEDRLLNLLERAS